MSVAALGTTELFSGTKAPGSTGNVIDVTGFTATPSGDVLVETAQGRLSIIPPDGHWSFGTTADGAWQRCRIAGTLLIARSTDPGDAQPVRAYLLATSLPNVS